MGLALLGADDDRPALVEGASGRTLSYAALHVAVARAADEIGDHRGTVALLGMASTIEAVVAELSLVAAGAVVALLDPATPAGALHRLVDAYAPEWVQGFVHHPDGPVARRAEPVAGAEALLLPTSGTTGSPKVVRLGARQVEANADQIATALRLGPDERAMAHLPLFYSYGLSVLHSHLHAGAAVVLSSTSVLRPEFWDELHAHRATSLPGVPYSYEMFRRVGLLERDLPHLRHLTQAGGRLAPERIRELHAALAGRGVDLWIMYGQTEATARLCVLAPEDLPEHVGSVGRAVPGGALRIDGAGADGVGEVVFEGPNVMLGYAEGRTGLGAHDDLCGVLRTGDLGRFDDGGRLWLTGRIKRIAKLYGTRVSLDDVEALAGHDGATVAALDGGDGVVLCVEGSPEEAAALGRHVERGLGVPPRSVRVRALGALPLTPAGKVDYRRLQDER